MHIYNITYQSSALSWLSSLLTYLCALRGSCLTILPFTFSDPKVSSLAQLILVPSHIFCKWEYVSDISSDSLCIQRYTSFLFPGDRCLIWVWVIDYSPFSGACEYELLLPSGISDEFECYSDSFYCESYFVWKLKRIYLILGIWDNLPEYL